ncbi:MAG: DUF1365 domain-containing protein [Beijerinckiaceae bacterium]
MLTMPQTLAFQPPAAPALLYLGKVMHARMKPKTHRFNYSVYALVIDVARLDEANRASHLFSVNRFNLLSFHERDHGAGNGASLKEHASTLLTDAGVSQPLSRVLLMCYPRVLGFTFNPIAVYFCYNDADALTGIIYEVRNTFGDMHTYVAPVKAGELSEAGIRQERQKLFHVSPFMDMDMHYKFRLRPPTDDLSIRILETDSAGPILAATFVGRRKDLTSGTVAGAFLRIPLLTLKVVGGIHWEAMKLWFKGIRFFTRPTPPPATSVDGIFHNTNNRLQGRP